MSEISAEAVRDYAQSHHADLERAFTAPKESPKPEPRIRALSLGELLAMEIPPREPLLQTADGATLLHRQDTVMIHSRRGVGKTFFAMGLAHAIASGGRFLRYQAPKPMRVLYDDGELPAATVQGRFAEIQAHAATEPPEGFLRIVTPDCQELPLPNLATPEGQEAIAPLLEDTDVFIVDNLSVLAFHGRENDSESWTPVQEWVLRLRRQGITVVLLHHSGKSGLQRGTSRREDILDLTINLSHPSDYEPSEGARFTISFEKNRGNLGAAAKPFEARLENGIWSIRDVDDLNLARAKEMRKANMSYGEIAQELGLNKSKVYRMLAER
jgi:putative DNA primase/helicase